MQLYSMKVELLIDRIPPRWLEIFKGASPGRRWVMITNAHLNNMDVSFGDYEVAGDENKTTQADKG